jgi:hypothetical protein
MHRCLVTKNGTDISPQMFEISLPSGTHGNMGMSAYKSYDH